MILSGTDLGSFYAGPGSTQLILQLDPIYSPPSSIPSNPADMIYNAPENDHMLEAVRVNILLDGVHLIDPVTVTVTTILATNFNSSNTVDSYTGTLCQHNKWTSTFETCRFMNNDCVELNCNTSDPYYPLGKVEAMSENGIATFDRLSHTKYTGFANRRLRFFAQYNGSSTMLDSNPFGVDCKPFISIMLLCTCAVPVYY